MNQDIAGVIALHSSLGDIRAARRVCTEWAAAFVIPPIATLTDYRGNVVCVQRHDHSIHVIDIKVVAKCAVSSDEFYIIAHSTRIRPTAEIPYFPVISTLYGDDFRVLETMLGNLSRFPVLRRVKGHNDMSRVSYHEGMRVKSSNHITAENGKVIIGSGVNTAVELAKYTAGDNLLDYVFVIGDRDNTYIIYRRDRDAVTGCGLDLYEHVYARTGGEITSMFRKDLPDDMDIEDPSDELNARGVRLIYVGGRASNTYAPDYYEDDLPDGVL